MTDHLKVLSVVVNLAVGAAVASYVWQKARSTAAPFLKPLVAHVILMNVAGWTIFLARYSMLNMPATRPIAETAALVHAATVASYVIYSGMVYAVLRVVAGILGTSIPARLTRAYFAVTAVFLLGYGVRWLVPAEGWWRTLHYHTYENAVLLYILLEISALVHLWRKSVAMSDAAKARLGRSFAMVFLARYPALVLVALLPQPAGGFVFLLLLNLVPLLWLGVWFQEYVERSARVSAASATSAVDLEAFCRGHSLSKREQEILALVLLGKSNRDIEQALFISYHTVKNHVYNIFKKLGVENRFELARLVDTEGRKPPPA